MLAPHAGDAGSNPARVTDMAKWCNWNTRDAQNIVPSRAWEFDSAHGHFTAGRAGARLASIRRGTRIVTGACNWLRVQGQAPSNGHDHVPFSVPKYISPQMGEQFQPLGRARLLPSRNTRQTSNDIRGSAGASPSRLFPHLRGDVLVPQPFRGRVRKQEKRPGREPGDFVGSTPTSVIFGPVVQRHDTSPTCWRRWFNSIRDQSTATVCRCCGSTRPW